MPCSWMACVTDTKKDQIALSYNTGSVVLGCSDIAQSVSRSRKVTISEEIRPKIFNSSKCYLASSIPPVVEVIQQDSCQGNQLLLIVSRERGQQFLACEQPSASTC